MKILKKKYDYCFFGGQGYIPILKANNIKNKFSLGTYNNKINFKTFNVKHGQIHSTAYVFNKIAYLSDCNDIDKKNFKNLKNLNYLIIDCLRRSPHPSHFNLETALKYINLLKPRKAILTNLHNDLDYNYLKKILPRNIIPAFDGMKIKI